VTRALAWEGCLNVRDLGGVPLAGGGLTRFGALLRADNVGRLTPAGWRSLSRHGVARIVDLRWPEERAEDPPRDLNVEVVHVSLLGRFDPSYSDDIDRYIEAGDPVGYWAAAYGRIVTRHRANFGAALAAIAGAPDGPVLFHCTAGRDRTGLISALLLRLAGAPVDEIAADYAQSEHNLAPDAERFISGASDEVGRRRRAFMQAAPADAMAQVLAGLEERYGDVVSYMRAAGLADAQIGRLRSRLNG
jgi:protein-tyrosine phosphatase